MPKAVGSYPELRALIARRIRERREASGLSQYEVSVLVGVTRSTYALYEAGRTTPSVFALVAVAVALKSSIDYILGLSSRPGSAPRR